MCKRFGFIRSLTHTLTKKHFYLNVLCLVSFVYQEVGNLFYSNDKKKRVTYSPTKVDKLPMTH